MPEIPDRLWTAVLANVRRMEKEELAYYRMIRPLYEELFPTFDRQMQEQFYTAFSPLLTDPLAAPTFDLLRAKQTGLLDTWTAELDTMLTAIEDEWVEIMEEEIDEAHDEGWWMLLWLLFLQNRRVFEDEDVEALQPPPDALAYVVAGSFGAVAFTERARQWRRQAVEKFYQQMSALAASGATGREVQERTKVVLAQYQRGLTALGADELYLAHIQGQDRALNTVAVGSYARWLWITRDDEKVCTEETASKQHACAPLHLTFTDLRPIFDTHPRCRCITIPWLTDDVPGGVLPYEAFKRRYS